MPGARECGSNLDKWALRKRAGLHALLNVLGRGTLQAYAQENAPWTDRTGNARQGLHGGAYSTPIAEVLYLAHTMEYGVFLEKSRAGKYAILKPTLNAKLPYIREVVTRYWEG